MRWCACSWFVAFAAAWNLVACGSTTRYPQPRVLADGRFMERARPVTSVDVLPVDVQMWTYEGAPEDPESARTRFDAIAIASLNHQLARRNYDVTANLGWDGTYVRPDGRRTVALSADALAHSVYALSGYGYAVSQARRGLLIPHLPHRLGTSTGSDATLYVGGWAYLGKDLPKRSNKVAKGVLIGLAVVLIVVVVIAAIAGKGGKGGGGGARVASGAARAAGSLAKGTARVLRATPRISARTLTAVIRGMGRVTHQVARGLFEADAWGRTNTHLRISGGRPDYFRQDRLPHAGRAQMLLEMTLIDNRSGQVLWHARQTFRANAARPEQVNRVLETMMASMPMATSRPHMAAHR